MLIIRVIAFELIQPMCPRYHKVTDGRKDRQTDRRTDDLRLQYRASTMRIAR